MNISTWRWNQKSPSCSFLVFNPFTKVIIFLTFIILILHDFEYYINVINKYVTSWDWLFLLSIMPMIPIQVVVCFWSLLFLLLDSIPCNGRTMVCLNSHILRDIWVVTTFFITANSSAINFMFRFLYRWKFSFLWDTCPGVQLLSGMVSYT